MGPVFKDALILKVWAWGPGAVLLGGCTFILGAISASPQFKGALILKELDCLWEGCGGHFRRGQIPGAPLFSSWDRCLGFSPRVVVLKARPVFNDGLAAKVACRRAWAFWTAMLSPDVEPSCAPPPRRLPSAVG